MECVLGGSLCGWRMLVVCVWRDHCVGGGCYYIEQSRFEEINILKCCKNSTFKYTKFINLLPFGVIIIFHKFFFQSNLPKYNNFPKDGFKQIFINFDNSQNSCLSSMWVHLEPQIFECTSTNKTISL